MSIDNISSVRVPTFWTSLKMVNEVNAAVNGNDATIHDVDVLKNFHGNKEIRKMIIEFFFFRLV